VLADTCALITGRNHHSVGFGVISEQSRAFRLTNSIISKDKATIGRILLDNGYGDLMVRQGSQHTGVLLPARSGRLIYGLRAWDSSISTASLAAMRTSGSRTCSATPRRFIRSRANRMEPRHRHGDDAIDYLNRIN